MDSTKRAEPSDSTRELARRQQRVLAGFVGVLGLLALLVPLWPELAPERRLGLLLFATGAMEFFHGFRRAEAVGRRAAWFGATITGAMGLVATVTPALLGRTVMVLMAGWFVVDGVRYAVDAVRAARDGSPWRWNGAAAAGNLAVALLMLLLRGQAVLWTMALVAAIRIFGTAVNILRTRAWGSADASGSVLSDLGLDALPEMQALGERLEREEQIRKPLYRLWIATGIVTLFAIHLGRMGLDRSALGILSPLVAVLGDLALALVFGLGIVVPIALALRTLLRPVERRAWRVALATPSGTRWRWRRSLLRWWLTRRLRLTIRLRQASFSLRTMLRFGLGNGLPFASIVAATMPVWGVSWYFDSESYAAGVWNSWAEARTDDWREAMVGAVTADETGLGHPPPTFRVEPPGVTDSADFAFLVIGDTGEGDASQAVLRDQLILAAADPDVRFVVISSDVVYPTGAMRDYEKNFWLPFKGVAKPVYAIPGNHDWYDALEAFAATFLETRAARTVMRARIESDLNLSLTDDSRIDELIAEAERLRGLYRVPTGFQQGPFFQFQTDRFALFAVDTGVQKRLDPAQLAWFERALESARGKLKMAILGHPLYAVGEYRAATNIDFAALHGLLRKHDVRIVMAGDTHDLEYYAEVPEDGETMHHFVNGGGGAFLTLGAQLADPAAMPTREWAFYPQTAPIVAKIEAQNPPWKAPLWLWTRDFKAWPSAPEWLSAAFDYNVAPFFQSFFDVRVEPSAGRVRLRPWGIHGRLRWSDLATSADLRPADTAPDAPVEWSFDLPAGAMPL